jgi:hypothetical protein
MHPMFEDRDGSGGSSEPAAAGVIRPRWDTQENQVTLHRRGWASYVGRTGNFRCVAERLEWDYGTFTVYEAREVRLSQIAALTLLQGGSLVDIFDGSFALTPGAGGKAKPMLLAGADPPSLVRPMPTIAKVALVSVVSLTDDGIELHVLRAKLFHDLVAHNLFRPGVT